MVLVDTSVLIDFFKGVKRETVDKLEWVLQNYRKAFSDSDFTAIAQIIPLKIYIMRRSRGHPWLRTTSLPVYERWERWFLVCTGKNVPSMSLGGRVLKASRPFFTVVRGLPFKPPSEPSQAREARGKEQDRSRDGDGAPRVIA